MTPTSAIKKRERCVSWMKLMLNVIPSIVFGVFTIVFTIQQNSIADATRQQEREHVLQQRQQTLFDNCIDVISNFLITPHFNQSNPEHLNAIREKVLTTLRQVNLVQKRDIIFFLYTNKLIRGDVPEAKRLDLHGADLNNVHFVASDHMNCFLNYLYLPGVLASNVIFSGCYLQLVDFSESIMRGSVFRDCILGFTRFINVDFTGAVFVNSMLSKDNFEGSLFFQASFRNSTPMMSMIWTNADFFMCDIKHEDLYGLLPPNWTSSSITLNARLPNGSFVLNTSQLLFNGGAEEGCDETSQESIHWQSSFVDMYLSMYKPSSNSTEYPLAVEGRCYFIGWNGTLVAQSVSVQHFSKFIDTGRAAAQFSLHLGCVGMRGEEDAVAYLAYFDKDWFPLRTSSVALRTASKPFIYFSGIDSIPKKSRIIRFYLANHFQPGPTANSSRYCVFDDIQLFIIDESKETS